MRKIRPLFPDVFLKFDMEATEKIGKKRPLPLRIKERNKIYYAQHRARTPIWRPLANMSKDDHDGGSVVIREVPIIKVRSGSATNFQPI